MNYRVKYVNLETNFTTIQIVPTIESALNIVKELMFSASHKYSITITTKEIQ